jgi:hypothetical protein
MSTDFGGPTRPVAQKAYRCEWCGETIPVKERHVKYSGKWEGEFQNWRMHNECYSAADDNDELSEGFSPYEHERPDGWQRP